MAVQIIVYDHAIGRTVFYSLLPLVPLVRELIAQADQGQQIRPITQRQTGFFFTFDVDLRAVQDRFQGWIFFAGTRQPRLQQRFSKGGALLPGPRWKNMLITGAPAAGALRDRGSNAARE